jgi:hypothetical protein
MWEWRAAMEKADPYWEGKMPIEFFGKVVDQDQVPIPGATAVLEWTTAVGSDPAPRRSVETDLEGKFQLADVQGKRLVVNVLKQGYEDTKESQRSFEFADFSDFRFYVPDRDHPVIFRLQKLGQTEPMYKFHVAAEMPLGADSLAISSKTGKIGAGGDLKFSANIGAAQNRYGPEYSITLFGLNGSVIASSNDEFLWNAPADGYQGQLEFAMSANNPKYSRSHKWRFYVRTADAKYAAADLDVEIIPRTSKLSISGLIYFNPSGSHNLTFDFNKCLNP